MKILLPLFLIIMLAGCSSSYSCNASPELCSLYIEQAENNAIMKTIKESVGETCTNPTKEDSFEMRKMDKKTRGQYILSCNELIVRQQYNQELWNMINQ